MSGITEYIRPCDRISLRGRELEFVSSSFFILDIGTMHHYSSGSVHGIAKEQLLHHLVSEMAPLVIIT